MRELIVSADDIGFSTTNTDTILDTVDRGVTTSVSILPNGAAFEYAVGECKKRPQLRISVHVNLVEGRALLPKEEVSYITDAEGNFKGPYGLLWAYLWHKEKVEEEVRSECRAQIQKVRAAFGIDVATPIPVDGHMHAHMLPFVWDALISLQQECGIGEMRLTYEPLYVAWTSLSSYTLRHIVATLGFNYCAEHARREAARVGVTTNEVFVGILCGGYMNRVTAEMGLRAASHRNPTRTEILFHPGEARSGEVAYWKGDQNVHLAHARAVEHEYLLSPEARMLVSDFISGNL